MLLADTCYPWFLSDHYGSRTGLERRPYREQLASVISRGMSRADIYSDGLRALGHQTADILVNCEPAQRRWLDEQRSWRRRVADRWSRVAGRPEPEPPRLAEIALAQVEASSADLLYVQDPCFFGRGELDRMRDSGVRVAGQIASRLPATDVLRGYELLVSSLPHFVSHFNKIGVEGRYLPLGFDQRVMVRLSELGIDCGPESERPHRVSFVGGVHPLIHPARVKLLEQVAIPLELELWGHGIDELAPESPLRASHRGLAWGLEMHQILARSRIVINVHSDVAAGYSNNMRLFEATGAGALLFTEPGHNLAELFEPEREVVTYDGAQDLIRKVRHYLDHPLKARTIAAAGQARTLAEHTYHDRMPELSRLLERGAQRREPERAPEPTLRG
jgi:spore maturation protein CgeB